jgi:hypothetical protein
MDEAKVAEQVAQNIPKDEPVAEVTVPVSEEPKLSAFETNIELNDPAISLRLADYLDVSKIDRLNDERQAQMRTLYRWGAEKANSTDLGDVLSKIRTLEVELGIRYKPDRLSTLSRWVKLNNQASSLRKEMEALSGNTLPTGF